MAVDHNDKRLMNSVIMGVIGMLIFYYCPSWGYKDRAKHTDDQASALKDRNATFTKFYPSMLPVHYGEFGGDMSGELPHGSMPISELKKEYDQSNTAIATDIKTKEENSRMNFAPWTEIPPENSKEPGVYFFEVYDKHRDLLKHQWEQASVENLDEEIGFGAYTGVIFKDENIAKEKLRELFVAEKIITLCINAKLREEENEKRRRLQPEAYMQIISVKPQESSTAGPSLLKLNPQYNPDEKDPRSKKFGKYRVEQLRHFIQEYPVEITLQCDVNTFERFLYSVRTPGQFLVIRSLEILSPQLEESQNDKSELRIFKGSMVKETAVKEATNVTPGTPPAPATDNKIREIKPGHIVVRMSAAGMDFFDPIKSPRGIYSSKMEVAKPPPRNTHRTILGN